MKNNISDQTKQDDYLKSNVNNLVKAAQNKGIPVFSCFLDERQRLIAQSVLNHSGYKNYLFFGGIEECDRVMLGVFPIEQTAEGQLFPIAALKLTFNENERDKLSHRDCLGSLMGLQLKREVIGDILLQKDRAVIFVSETVADFVTQNLDKVGRIGVKVTQTQETDFQKEQEFEEIRGTVSSLRLDCVVAMLLNKGRSAATELILSQSVRVNYQETQNVSKQIHETDVIAIRGKGKFIVAGDFKKTKKDRFFITIHKLV